MLWWERNILRRLEHPGPWPCPLRAADRSLLLGRILLHRSSRSGFHKLFLHVQRCSWFYHSFLAFLSTFLENPAWSRSWDWMTFWGPVQSELSCSCIVYFYSEVLLVVTGTTVSDSIRNCWWCLNARYDFDFLVLFIQVCVPRHLYKAGNNSVIQTCNKVIINLHICTPISFPILLI